MLEQADRVGVRADLDMATLRPRIDGILSRRPAVGLAIGVIRDGDLALFHGHGLADIASRTPVTADTVFRIGSVSKLFTAVAVLQLCELGLVDLDCPVGDYLRAFRLVPTGAGVRPVTLRHLLTHTSGIPELRGPGDLLHAAFTPSGGRSAMPTVRAGARRPALADVYRDGLRVVVEPGTAFAYSNHGFAVLGQVVEDVTGTSLDAYLQSSVFGPLGMRDSGLVRTARIASRLATGYLLGRRGPRRAPDLEEVGGGGGGVYSTTRDMARFAAALLGSGSGEHGPILRTSTVASMCAPQFRPDPRVPGVGLAFFRGGVGGHRVVGHDGILPGFNSAMLLAPDDGVGIVGFTNGSSGAFAWLDLELHELLREVLGAPSDTTQEPIPEHPETWAGLCGRYVLPPRISDLRGRLMMGGGAEVFVDAGRLTIRLLTPHPMALRGLPLRAADRGDPDVYVLDPGDAALPRVRIVFVRDAEGRATRAHADVAGQPWSLIRVGDLSARRLVRPAVGALAVAALVASRRQTPRPG